uniref:Uncharacterized protein n=1 Tax=Panagrolaimus davidi TaxID=227884 RepID=A0A914P1T3_9BILA
MKLDTCRDVFINTKKLNARLETAAKRTEEVESQLAEARQPNPELERLCRENYDLNARLDKERNELKTRLQDVSEQVDIFKAELAKAVASNAKLEELREKRLNGLKARLQALAPVICSSRKRSAKNLLDGNESRQQPHCKQRFGQSDDNDESLNRVSRGGDRGLDQSNNNKKGSSFGEFGQSNGKKRSSSGGSPGIRGFDGVQSNRNKEDSSLSSK